MSDDLEKKVHEALDNAIANGYEDMVNWDDEDIAVDLGTYDADLEGLEVDVLIPHITTWRAKMGVPNCGRLGIEIPLKKE